MSQGAAEREIEATIRGMFRKFMDHEPGGVEAALHDDCTVWDVFTPQLIQGRAERDRFHEADQKQAQARGPLTMTIGPMIISVWDDTAVARYVVEFVYQPPNPAEGAVRITSVLRREGGRWRIVHHHEGIVPAGPPPIA